MEMLAELCSITIMDLDRRLVNRAGHDGDLAMLEHGKRLAAGLVYAFEDPKDDAPDRITKWMHSTVKNIGDELAMSAALLKHSLTPAKNATVN